MASKLKSSPKSQRTQKKADYLAHPEPTTSPTKPIYKKSKLRSNPLIPFKELKDLIVYGISGSGKYSSVLYYLSTFSNSCLKYDKKIYTYNKQDKSLNISIH